MKSHSLKYIDYTKRQLNKKIGQRIAFSFINPINYKGRKIFQVEIVDHDAFVYDGKKWEVTVDEELIFKILQQFERNDKQKEIPFREAV